MTHLRPTVLAMLTLTLAAATSAHAASVYNDGGVHTFSGTTDVVAVNDDGAGNGTTLNIIDPAVISTVLAVNNFSTVNISGGTLDAIVVASNASTINISGGTLNSMLAATEASTINIFGGTFNDVLASNAAGTINFHGLADLAMTFQESLDLYDQYWISGTLQDGSSIDTEFQLYEGGSFSVSTVPTPSAAAGGLALLALLSGGRVSRRRRDARSA